MSENTIKLKDRLKTLKMPFKLPFKVPNKKKMFWAWVTYQAIKGSLTTAFIWIPAILYWFHS